MTPSASSTRTAHTPRTRTPPTKPMLEELGKKQKKTSDFLTGMKYNPKPTKN
jgi:hypothetical protein